MVWTPYPRTSVFHNIIIYQTSDNNIQSTWIYMTLNVPQRKYSRNPLIILYNLLPLICKELNGTRHTHSLRSAHLTLKGDECVQKPSSPNPPPTDSWVQLHSLSYYSTGSAAVILKNQYINNLSLIIVYSFQYYQWLILWVQLNFAEQQMDFFFSTHSTENSLSKLQIKKLIWKNG